MKKLVVFDWDGTLADSVPSIIRVKQHLAQKYGFHVPSEETIKSVLGLEFSLAMSRCFPNLVRERLIKLNDEFKRIMSRSDKVSPLFPGVDTLLNKLASLNVYLAVASSKSRKELELAISKHALRDHFALVCSSDDFPNRGKPNPEMLIHIMRSLSITPDDTIMVGDSVSDIQMAKNASVASIAVSYGAHNKAQLLECNPDYLCDSVEAVSERLL